MKRFLTALLVIVVVLTGWGMQAEAAIELHPAGSGLGSATIVYTGNAQFIHPGYINAVLKDVMVAKVFDSLGTIQFDNVTYLSTDLSLYGFGSGFRWTERITNNTGVAWTDYHLVLDEAPGVFFTDLPVFSPSFVVINDAGDIPGTGTPKIVKTDSLGTVVLSSDRKSLSYYFATPLLPGEFFDIHAPVEGLASYTYFGLAQSPSAVPEPATLLIWSVLGALALGSGWWRKKEAA